MLALRLWEAHDGEESWGKRLGLLLLVVVVVGGLNPFSFSFKMTITSSAAAEDDDGGSSFDLLSMSTTGEVCICADMAFNIPSSSSKRSLAAMSS